MENETDFQPFAAGLPPPPPAAPDAAFPAAAADARQDPATPAPEASALTDFAPRTDLARLTARTQAVRTQIGQVIVGQQDLLELLLTALLADGHVLLEGVPGVAKTLTAKLLARTLDVPFSRIQFTPDLMPADVLGTSIYRPAQGDFEFRPGPIFASVVLIDEINRAPGQDPIGLV